MSGIPPRSGEPSEQPTHAEVIEREQEINRTSASLPLPRTALVLSLLAEAHKPEHVIWREITHEDTPESRAHNDRMKQLWEERPNERMPGLCVCNVKEPSDTSKTWFQLGHPCRDHAKQWFHFFHCARTQSEDFSVMQQQLGWCRCEACEYFSRQVARGIASAPSPSAYSPFQNRRRPGF